MVCALPLLLYIQHETIVLLSIAKQTSHHAEVFEIALHNIQHSFFYVKSTNFSK